MQYDIDERSLDQAAKSALQEALDAVTARLKEEPDLGRHGGLLLAASLIQTIMDKY